MVEFTDLFPMNITKIIFSANLLLTLVFFHFAFGKGPDRRYTFRLKTGAFLFLLLTLLSGGMLWKEKRSVQVLKSVIAVPEVSGVTAFPSQKEMEMISATMRVLADFWTRAGHPASIRLKSPGSSNGTSGSIR